MTTLVILRFLGIFAAYTGVTLALPALMFRQDPAGQKSGRTVSDVLHLR